ncbi:MAG: hypothetical protein LBS00_07325 [Synergistaceae bacterium]|jgi:hypothetical protein|nr:hypothetical protein [Synergistaceae bacterium]
MNFRYYEQDKIDEVPAPAGKMAISLVAIIVLFLALLYGTAALLVA